MVAQGDTAVTAWLEANTASVSPMLATWWDIARCAAAIALAVGGIALPAAKILKIKQIINAMGGVRNFGKAVIEVFKLIRGTPSLPGLAFGQAVFEVFKNFGQIIVDLAAEVLGIHAIITFCVPR